MKRNVIIAVIAVFVIVIIALAYNSYSKKLNALPEPVEFASREEAMTELTRLEGLKSKGLSWQDTFRIGVLYMHAGKLSEAKVALEDAAKRRPKFDKTHESLGMLYYRSQDFDNAIKHWSEALKLNSKAEHLKDMIEKAEMRRGMNIRMADLEKKKTSLSEGEKFELAAIYVGVNRLDEAETMLNDILKKNKNLPSVYDGLAEVSARKGNFAKAISYEKQAIKLAPKDENLKKRLSEMERILSAQKKGVAPHKAATKK